MRILILSDLHLRHHAAEELISKVEHDKVIFLGDYFDQFNDSPIQNQEAAQWLKESLTKENRIHLWGNHDIHYGLSSQFACSGYEQPKDYAINQVMQAEDWKKLKFWHYEDGFFFSHGGFKYQLFKGICSRQHFSTNLVNNTPEKVLEVLNAEWMYAANQLAGNMWPVLLAPGMSRGGDFQHGGLLWCDVNEFHPIPNFNQVFGHTPVRIPCFLYTTKGEFHTRMFVGYTDFHKIDKSTLSSYNLALDTHGRHYAILENGVINVYAVSDLR